MNRAARAERSFFSDWRGWLVRLESAAERPYVYLAAVGALGALALAMRLAWLERNYAQGWDEGAYLLAARLIAAGFRPFSEIYMPQLPLFLHNLAWVFQLGAWADSVLVGRLVVAAYSFLGLSAALVVAGALSNRWGALAALLILVLNPAYFTYSRAVYLEVPGAALVMVALACLVGFMRQGARVWLVLAGLFWAWSVLVKPFSLGFGLTLWLLIVLYRWDSLSAPTPIRRRTILADSLILGLAALVPVLFFLATNDLAAFYFQFVVVNQRLIPTSPLDEITRVWTFLGRDWGMLALGAFAAVAGPRPPGARSTLPLALGILATLFFILQVPAYNHHSVVLIPALGTLAGAGVGIALERLRGLAAAPVTGAVRSARAMLLVGGLALVIYGVNLPRVLLFDYRLLQIPEIPAPAAACIRMIQTESLVSDYVVTDQPMLVYRAGRMAPPAVAIAGGADIQAGGVTTAALIDSAETFPTPFIVVSNRFRTQPDWIEWVQAHYRRAAVCSENSSELVELYRVNE